MQETKIFKAIDSKDIRVEVNAKEGNSQAVLMIHGITGNVDEHIFYNAARQWPKKGLDVWRIALYPGEDESTRSMLSVTWEQNLSDINITLAEMAKVYPAIFLVGHSIGATQAVLASHEHIKAKALWDPYYPVGGDEIQSGNQEFHPDFFTIDWGHILLVRKDYAAAAIQASHYSSAIPLLQPPLLVVRAGQTQQKWPHDRLAAKLAKIKDADHGFNREGNEASLFRRTLKFFQAYSASPAVS